MLRSDLTPSLATCHRRNGNQRRAIGTFAPPEFYERLGLQKQLGCRRAGKVRGPVTDYPIGDKLQAVPNLKIWRRGAGASLEEADTQIQTVSCHAQERDDSKAANDGDQIQSEVSLRLGNSLRGNLRDRLHDNLQVY